MCFYRHCDGCHIVGYTDAKLFSTGAEFPPTIKIVDFNLIYSMKHALDKFLDHTEFDLGYSGKAVEVYEQDLLTLLNFFEEQRIKDLALVNNHHFESYLGLLVQILILHFCKIMKICCSVSK